MIVNKKVKLQLAGRDGNAFFLMAAFSHQAKREGWKREEIDAVLAECKKANYEHLLCTLIDHCEEPDEFDDEE
jgi:hypothetical protein